MQQLRELFNRHYGRRLQQLDLVVRTSRALRANIGEPPGTQSITYDVYHRGESVALVHCYLRPDGSLGASGLYDPKAVLIGAVLYIPEV